MAWRKLICNQVFSLAELERQLASILKRIGALKGQLTPKRGVKTVKRVTRG